MKKTLRLVLVVMTFFLLTATVCLAASQPAITETPSQDPVLVIFTNNDSTLQPFHRSELSALEREIKGLVDYLRQTKYHVETQHKNIAFSRDFTVRRYIVNLLKKKNTLLTILRQDQQLYSRYQNGIQPGSYTKTLYKTGNLLTSYKKNAASAKADYGGAPINIYRRIVLHDGTILLTNRSYSEYEFEPNERPDPDWLAMRKEKGASPEAI
ncbi:MAG: hypothetical protein M1338_00970 [Patescibacteria group bacterium]|nr:hypothetical protein [Patescibacteria group bacterium]